jgi:hypothetical protein
MPVHELTCRVPASIVVNKDLVIEIRSDDELLGNLHISRGSIDWAPANTTTRGRTLSWERFDELMRLHGTAKRIPRKGAA